MLFGEQKFLLPILYKVLVMWVGIYANRTGEKIINAQARPGQVHETVLATAPCSDVPNVGYRQNTPVPGACWTDQMAAVGCQPLLLGLQ